MAGTAGVRPELFSWIIDKVLAGCAFPHQKGHFQYMLNEGIGHLVTLTDCKPPMNLAPPGTHMACVLADLLLCNIKVCKSLWIDAMDLFAGLEHTHIPVCEFQAPSVQQIQDFVAIVDRARRSNQGVAVHCHWGYGRTGTMLAAYLVKDCGMTARSAIAEIRRLRPHSIETSDQEEVLFLYDELQKDGTAGKDATSAKT